MIVIEGTVGVGKTSLLELLVGEGYVPFREPVIDNPILDKFYHNRKRYAFASQVFFLNRRFEQLQASKDIKNVVMDRSIYGDAIFASLLNENRELSDVEYEIFKELSDNLARNVRKPKLMIYLEASTDEAIRRIGIRGRDYEQEVEREYWRKLNEKYQEFFDNYDVSPILRINVDKLDFKNNFNDREYIMNKIKEKIKEIEVN